MPMSDKMMMALMNDVESTLNMVERVAPAELSTGYVVRYEGQKAVPSHLTNYERYRQATLDLLLDVWGDIDDEKYQALLLRRGALVLEHDKIKARILATPPVAP